MNIDATEARCVKHIFRQYAPVCRDDDYIGGKGGKRIGEVFRLQVLRLIYWNAVRLRQHLHGRRGHDMTAVFRLILPRDDADDIGSVGRSYERSERRRGKLGRTHENYSHLSSSA